MPSDTRLYIFVKNFKPDEIIDKLHGNFLYSVNATQFIIPYYTMHISEYFIVVAHNDANLLRISRNTNDTIQLLDAKASLHDQFTINKIIKQHEDIKDMYRIAEIVAEQAENKEYVDKSCCIC